jgi:hypothetical protein
MTDVLIYWIFFYQTMGVHEFTETVSCFMRVTWAAAAGRLHLLGSSQPIIESSTGLYGCGRRSRQSSTGKFFFVRIVVNNCRKVSCNAQKG